VRRPAELDRYFLIQGAAKLTPFPSNVAPKGDERPGQTRIVFMLVL
jgi:hypothetical protein